MRKGKAAPYKHWEDFPSNIKIPLFFLFALVSCLLSASTAFAENIYNWSMTISDPACDYSSRMRELGDKASDASSEASSKIREKQEVLSELRQGYYCSKCNRSKSELDRTSEGFEHHLERVKGQPVPAPQSVINQREAEFDREINNLNSRRRQYETEMANVKREFNNCEQASLKRKEEEYQRKKAELKRKQEEQRQTQAEKARNARERAEELKVQ